MRVVVFGATGNIGTSVLAALVGEPLVEQVVGVARRIPDAHLPKVVWRAADVSTDPLDDIVEGADAVVHLAWAIQPSHDDRLLRRVNVLGSARVFASAVRAQVPTLVYASSVGTYAPADAGERVDESWPNTGVPTSQYSRDKADVEYILDRVEEDHPEMRIVRLRKALVFKRAGASEVKRLFLGPLAPTRLIGRHGLPVVPRDDRLAFQVVHSHDAGEAYRLAVVGTERGPFNIATSPVVTPAVLAEILGARLAPISPRLLHAGARITHALRLQRAEPGWIDLAVSAPLMDTTAARTRLGWTPTMSSTETLHDLLAGFAVASGTETSPLHPGRNGELVPLRARTGVS
jgi:UDP-glucose 4-epimerase